MQDTSQSSFKFYARASTSINDKTTLRRRVETRFKIKQAGRQKVQNGIRVEPLCTPYSGSKKRAYMIPGTRLWDLGVVLCDNVAHHLGELSWHGTKGEVGRLKDCQSWSKYITYRESGSALALPEKVGLGGEGGMLEGARRTNGWRGGGGWKNTQKFNCMPLF